jgi:calcineurin-like phosphoesterase family protein
MQYDFFFSDPHFGHFNIIKYCNRPFRDADHMTEELVSRYNALVGVSDAVLWLGDCFFSSESATSILPRLNGDKWLLRGNHDKRVSDAKFLKAGFEAVFSQHFSSFIGEVPVRYSHYPFEGYSEDKKYSNLRPPREDGVVIVHGHTHEPHRLTPKGTVHVGVDAWDYGPASYSEVLDLVRKAQRV